MISLIVGRLLNRSSLLVGGLLCTAVTTKRDEGQVELLDG